MTDVLDFTASLLPTFPARVIEGDGIGITKSNGVYTFDLDVSGFGSFTSLSSGDQATTYFPAWNSATDTFGRVSVSSLSDLVASLINEADLTVTAGTGISVTGGTTVALDTNSNRNVDHSAVSITASTGLTGGGDLTATRSLAVDFASNAEIDTGTSTTKAVNPAGLAHAIAGISGSGLGSLTSLEIGSVAVSGSPFIDFHSSGFNIDYDSRLVGIGGTTTVGDGVLQSLNTFNISPRSGSLRKGLTSTLTMSGNAGGSFNGHDLFINDTVVCPNPPDFMCGLNLTHWYGGSGVKGGRASLNVESYLMQATDPSNPNRNYVGIQSVTVAQTNDKTGEGAFFAYGCYAELQPGVSALEVTGCEVNITARAGSAVKLKSGWSIVPLSDDAVQGSIHDAALSLSGQGGVGWRVGLSFNAANGAHPMNTSNGTCIGSVGTATTVHGIDFSSYTFAGNNIAFQTFLSEGPTGRTLIQSPVSSTWLRIMCLNSAGGTGILRMVTSASTGPREWAVGPSILANNGWFSLHDWSAGLDRLQIGLDGTVYLPAYPTNGTLITINGTGQVSLSSDARLKDVKGDYTNGLDAVLALQPKSFTWKSDPRQQIQAGFVAQDVRPYVPEAVDGDEDEHMLGFSDRPVLAAVVNAIKELNAKIEELRH